MPSSKVPAATSKDNVKDVGDDDDDAVNGKKNQPIVGIKKSDSEDQSTANKEPPTKKSKLSPSSPNSKNEAGGVVPGQRTVEVTLKLPPPPQKLGLILQDDKSQTTFHNFPILTAIRPSSTFHNVIPPHLINNYWITGIKDEEFGETQISDSKVLVEELTKRRKNGEERTVELQFKLRANSALQLQQNRQNMEHQQTAANNTTTAATATRTQGAINLLNAQQQYQQQIQMELLHAQQQLQNLNQSSASLVFQPELPKPSSLKKNKKTKTTEAKNSSSTTTPSQSSKKNPVGRTPKRKANEIPNEGMRVVGEQKDFTREIGGIVVDCCMGVQSKVVDDFVGNGGDTEYLIDKVKLNNFQGWRHRDCLFVAELDKHDRCTKCSNVLKKIGRQRTPLLYDSTESQLRRAAKRSLLPSTDDVKQIITSRINSIEDEGTIPADPTILLAAKVLKLKGKSVVELDKECLVNASDGYKTKTMFIVCDRCGVPMYKRKTAKNSSICKKCLSGEKRREKRMAVNKQDRVSINSHIPLAYLTSEEVSERYSNLKQAHVVLKAKLKKYDEKESKAAEKNLVVKNDGQQQQQFGYQQQLGKPMLPWPFYLNYNPDAAREYATPNTILVPLAPVAKAEDTTNAKRAAKPTRKKSSVACDKKAPPAATGSASSIVVSDNKPTTKKEGKVEEVVMEEVVVAEDPLDYASVDDEDGHLV